MDIPSRQKLLFPTKLHVGRAFLTTLRKDGAPAGLKAT
jgi:hypothetical protein